nr:MAG TPA: hypothetical protein [Caudoviricetes sp.]
MQRRRIRFLYILFFCPKILTFVPKRAILSIKESGL